MKVEEIEFISSKITERAEDYLRTIHKIIEQQGFAKTGDIALELNIKPASVFEMHFHSSLSLLLCSFRM
jgi:predicted house-cleaning noncanonical NTP pyrophosphatase (MazG superfamily)